MIASLFPDDIVEAVDEAAKVGEVLLVHEEVDTTDSSQHRLPWHSGGPLPTRHDSSISSKVFEQFTRDRRPPQGTVLVHWILLNRVELISASFLRARSRALFGGDIVKRNAGDAMSGVVLNTETTCTLQPVQHYETTSGKPVYGLTSVNGPDLSKNLNLQSSRQMIEEVPLRELELARDFQIDDIVVYGDWIGHIGALAQAYTVLLSNKTVVELTEPDSAAQDDLYWPYEVMLGDIVQTKKGNLRRGRWIYGTYDPSIPPVGVVASSRIIASSVQWLRSADGSSTPRPFDDQILDRVAMESASFRIYQRERRPTKQSLDTSTTDSELDVSLATRVKFADFTAACEKYGTSFTPLPRTETSGYNLNFFDIVSARKTVRVQWQDLSVTEHDSTELIPDLSLEDDHAVWPGEVVHSLDMVSVPGLTGVQAPSKVGIVQSVKANERMATIKWCPNASVHYTHDESVSDSASGPETPRILLQSIIGLADAPCEEVSLYDIEAPGELNVKRGDVVMINQLAAKRLSHIQGVNWLGEIVQEHLDGTLLIRLGAASPIQDVALRREEVTMAIRSDNPGLTGHDDHSDDDLLSIDDSMDTDSDSIDDNDVSDSTSNSVMSLTMREVTYEDEDGRPLHEDDVDDEDWESTSGMSDVDAPSKDSSDMRTFSVVDVGTGAAEPPRPASQAAAVVDATTAISVAALSEPANASAVPTQYTLVEGSAPTDHAYATEQAPPASNMKRIHKEHKILQQPGALPGGLYVTTWESRLDLLRVLFIGPQGTPYADAPFVMDIWLSTEFPLAPPKAFFHSWTGEASLGGSGRVNPNLYEDGTICLSLLGTWSGEKQENWNADKSTVLQVVVSVLGLVLVREPYFNEAGYEHLAGTEGAKRPSILYNERTCLRALNFTVSAVSALVQNKRLRGLDSTMEETLRWLYLAPDGAKLLSRVHEHVRATVVRSEEANEEPDGMNVLSQGACVQLRRLRERIQSLLTA